MDETSFAADSKLEAILVAPSNGSVLYANTTLNGASRIYRSDNGGSTWSYKGEGLIRAVSPASSETVYQASNGSVHRSANGGQSWTTVGTIRNTTGSLDGIAGLAISPGNPNLMLATMSGPNPTANGIFRSVNGGATWQQVRAGNNIGVQFSRSNQAEAIAGDCCALAVYHSSDNGATFSAVTRNLGSTPNVMKLSTDTVSFASGSPGKLLATVLPANGGGLASLSVPSTQWTPLAGTYTPSAVLNTTLPDARVLLGDTSLLHRSASVVAAEGGSADNFAVGTPQTNAQAIAVAVLKSGSEEGQLQPTLELKRIAKDLGAGNHSLQATIPVSGAANDKIVLNATLDVSDQPDGPGVYLGEYPTDLRSAAGTANSLAHHNGALYAGQLTYIYAIDAAGHAVVVAGNGKLGYTGDGGAATSASLSLVESITVTPDGAIYFREGLNYVIRRIDTNGVIQTVVGRAGSGISLTITEGMNVSDAKVMGEIASKSDGTLLFAQSGSIWRVSGSVLRRVAGGGSKSPADGVLASEASLSGADQIQVDEQDRIVFQQDSRLFRIERNGTLRHLGGTSPASASSTSSDARKQYLNLAAFAVRGDYIYFYDKSRARVRRIDPDFTVKDVALNGDAGAPSSCSGALYVPAVSTLAPSAMALAGPHLIVLGQSGLPHFWLPPASANPAPVPQVPANGIVHAGSFLQRIAPGSLISIFGTDVSNEQKAASRLPLPAELGGAVACVDGKVAPLIFASPLQVNAQVPFGVEPGSRIARFFNRNGGSSSVPVNVEATAPDAFRDENGRGIAINPDGSQNLPGRGVSPGEYVVVYLTGIGEVEPDLPTGAGAITDPLSVASAGSSATIGGKAANLEYLGHSPGFAGLAQANIRIPDLPPGEHPVVITAGASASTPFALTVK
ncbi:MAG: hypothetical protein KJZ70_07715 [Bryobacterales bacterium]|nr:hypothetical protein [Bryobacterales bacterium]